MKKSIFSLAMMAVLSACGGSSSDSSTPAPTPTPTPGAHPIHSLQMSNQDFDGAQPQTIADQKTRLVKIAGQEYDLEKLGAGVQAGGYVRINDLVYSGQHADDYVYGALQSGKDVHWFMQGEVVDKMPTSGKFSYHGTAFALKDGQALKDFEKSAIGKGFKAEVDFAAKTVVGRIMTPANESDFKAEIKGSAFMSGSKDDVRVSGHFFDDGAEKMAGFFRDNKAKVSGAFGGEKE